MAFMLVVGDKVRWRGAWGTEPEQPAIVTSIEQDCQGKCGTPTGAVRWDVIAARPRSVIVGLDNGHWAWGSQIAPAEEVQS